MLLMFATWGLIFTVAFANPVSPKNSNQLTGADQAPDGLELDGASSTIDPTDIQDSSDPWSFSSSEAVSEHSSDCLSDTAADDPLSRNDSPNGSIFQRDTVCAAKFSPTIPYPEAWQAKPSVIAKSTLLGNPCTKSRRERYHVVEVQK